MKKIMSVVAMVLFLNPAASFAAKTKVVKAEETAKTYTADVKASQLKWLGKKVTGQHEGTLLLKSGTVVVDNHEIKNAEFVIDMGSIKNSDIDDNKMNKKLVGHLKSEDFFDVAKYPTATLKVTQAKKVSENNYKVKGDLTIKGETHEVSFPVKVDTSKETHAVGTIEIDRTQWNIRYGSGKFFKGLGDKMIKDKFEVSFDVVLK